MARPVIPGMSADEQLKLYEQLQHYNAERDSYKVAGVYLLVIPHDGKKCYSLWCYSPTLERNPILFIQDLSEQIQESLRLATSMFFYSKRKLLIVEYNAKRMTSKGDDLIGFGKYRGHYLYEILQIDPAYVVWIANKYTPRIPKQERFVQIARVYVSVYLDRIWQKKKQTETSHYLGKKGQTVKDLTLKVSHVRLEDDPYKTGVQGNEPVFYVNQIVGLTDIHGNRVIIIFPALYPSLVSGQLSALEHAYRAGEILHVSTARIFKIFEYRGIKYTRLYYVRLKR
ncbi:hypothetical protein NEE14_007590 [Parabacteroides sp. AD58]|uniref:Exodeoxyribonuclease X-like C-terminal domain-containing protein n=1 Tax=Parabacteroides absconsus TaxID=2951805 RepID=A0ABZ2IP62_9BACT|nr:hypothetical protein [Parabacteroides sp. AD58]MCM6902954.1 hypothetical protein [Parabacteroides sp. AD58]